jgi:hypothetical protein
VSDKSAAITLILADIGDRGLKSSCSSAFKPWGLEECADAGGVKNVSIKCAKE